MKSSSHSVEDIVISTWEECWSTKSLPALRLSPLRTLLLRYEGIICVLQASVCQYPCQSQLSIPQRLHCLSPHLPLNYFIFVLLYLNFLSHFKHPFSLFLPLSICIYCKSKFTTFTCNHHHSLLPFLPLLALLSFHLTNISSIAAIALPLGNISYCPTANDSRRFSEVRLSSESVLCSQ